MLALRRILPNVGRAVTQTRAMTAFANPTPAEYINHQTAESRSTMKPVNTSSNPLYAAVSVFAGIVPYAQLT